MNNSQKIAVLALLTLSFFTNNYVIEAKVMSGSITERKQNAKVAKLLNSARKSVYKGKNQDAINAYWKILEIDSQEAYAYLELGEIYKNLKIYDRSIEMLTSGLELAKDELDIDTLCNYYCILTEAYSATHQQGLANKSLIKAAEIAPRNPMPRKILGDIYLKNNRVANAAKAYKKALELDPYYSPAIKALNELKLEYGNKLPKEDKDKDYIKKVAVKLADKDTNTKAKKAKVEPPVETNDEQDIIPKSYVDKERVELAKKEDIPGEEVTIVNEEDVKEDQTDIVNIEDKVSVVNDSRPLPLEEKEIAKINAERNKKKKQSDKPKPQTAEEIEKAMAEKESESSTESTNNKVKDEKDQEYIELFLAGNPTEKEEAVNYFINKGKPGLEQIEELIYDSNPDIRILAIRALPLFDDYKEEVRNILKEASDDTDPDVVEEVNKALNLL